MNILIFSHVKIYPADAGSRVRIYNFTNQLKKMGHKIHFVHYAKSSTDKIYYDFMQKNYASFNLIVQKKKTALKEGNYVLDEWYEDTIHLNINEMVERYNIDMVLTNYIFHSKFLEYLPKNVYKVIDTHDRFTDRYKLFSDKKSVKYTWHSYSQKDEAKALNRADLIISITDEENRFFSSICKKEVITIGHIENKKELNISYEKLKKIGFIGGVNQVNVVSINDFLEEFYNSSKNTQNIKIVIAGVICKSIKFKHENIELLGLVDELEEFYKSVDLVINPLMFGTGQKIKSIEALSYGVPILSTKIGFEGIYSDSEFHRIGSLKEMVQSIDTIVEKPKHLINLAKKSKEVFTSYKTPLNSAIESIFTNKKNTEILKAVEAITKISFFKHPLQKYKLYKNILKAYYAK